MTYISQPSGLHLPELIATQFISSGLCKMRLTYNVFDSLRKVAGSNSSENGDQLAPYCHSRSAFDQEALK